jgi:alkylhydroperoxidase family enzyme
MRHLRVRGTGVSGSDQDTITVRHASRADADALADLADLDSVRLPPGPLLLAEVDDELRAAISLTDGTVISDPFHLNTEVVARLRGRAEEFAD